VTDTYADRTYGSRNIGFGEKPGIVVVDFQLAFTDARYPFGGAPLIERGVRNTARVLEAARRCGVPVASCFTAYQSERDMPHWKIDVVREQFLHGHPCTALDERIYDADYDLAVCKSAPSIFFNTPVVPFLVKERVDTVIVTGCVTSGCIRASTIDSFSHGFRTIVPEDCVGDYDEGPHGDNLRDVGRRYCDVSSAEDVIAYLDAWRKRNR
jgi:maleamate amidohydrolase